MEASGGIYLSINSQQFFLYTIDNALFYKENLFKAKKQNCSSVIVFCWSNVFSLKMIVHENIFKYWHHKRMLSKVCPLMLNILRQKYCTYFKYLYDQSLFVVTKSNKQFNLWILKITLKFLLKVILLKRTMLGKKIITFLNRNT